MAPPFSATKFDKLAKLIICLFNFFSISLLNSGIKLLKYNLKLLFSIDLTVSYN